MVRSQGTHHGGHMKFRQLLTFGLLLAASGSCCTSPASAQAAPPESKIATLDEIKNQAELDKAITALDTKLFDAYNHCDLKTFDSLLADDVEFYHDQGGVTLGRQKLTESVKNNICTGDTQRVLVPGTLKIYYMKGYGAIEMGVHRFLHPKTESTNGTGEASFVQLWQCKDGVWKLTRVLSYDHHSASPKI
jgi:ketosteroid isomerase-like protein